jgi:hypothetical protein
LVIGYTGLLQLVTTSKDYVLTVLHISQITIAHTKSQSVTVFTSRCLVAAFNSGRSTSAGSPNDAINYFIKFLGWGEIESTLYVGH